MTMLADAPVPGDLAGDVAGDAAAHVAVPAAAETERGWRDVEHDIAEVVGGINALYGRLVGLVAEGAGFQMGSGFASVAQWVAWQAGLSRERGQVLALLAQRSAELPCTMQRLREGRISVDQAAPIARRAPAWGDRDLAEMAEAMTPRQISRCVRLYRATDDADPANDPYPDPDPADDDADPAPQPSPQPQPEMAASRFAGWFDADGRFVLRADLSVYDGAVFDAALRAHFDALWNEWKRRHESEVGLAQPTMAEAFIRMAEHSLDAEAHVRPHHRRCKVLVHVDVEHQVASAHLGQALPTGVWQWLACDATWQMVYERNGIPVGVGPSADIPERLRILVEHRDQGCRVPGCGARHVQIHHVRHRTKRGVSETWNLIALCPIHHRMHHLGRLGIHGTNADRHDGITFTDHLGRALGGVGRPRPPTNTNPPPDAVRYRPADGGRLDLRWVTPHPPWEQERIRRYWASREAESNGDPPAD